MTTSEGRWHRTAPGSSFTRTADSTERYGGPMLSPAALAAYQRDGFIVLPDILEPAQIEALRRVTDAFVDNARTITANDEVYDLEETHSSDEPRVRRIKAAHQSSASGRSGIRAGRPPSANCRGLAGSMGHGTIRYRQAQHEVGRVRGSGRMAPGPGPFIRTPISRLSGQPSGPGNRSSRPVWPVLRRDRPDAL